MILQKKDKWYLPWIKSQPFRFLHGNNYRTPLPRGVADSCHVLQSLIFTLGHMGETHNDGIPLMLQF